MKNAIDYKHGEFVLMSNNLLDYDNYEEYAQTCDDLGKAPAKEDSEEYWEAVAHMRDISWEADYETLKSITKEDGPVVVTGSLGLWNGRHLIAPMMFDSLPDAIDQCIEGGQGVVVTWKDGVVYVDASHHDGMNEFYISALSKKGQDKFRIAKERWEDVLLQDLKEWDFKRIPYPYA